jgi:hypothetical protein
LEDATYRFNWGEAVLKIVFTLFILISSQISFAETEVKNPEVIVQVNCTNSSVATYYFDGAEVTVGTLNSQGYIGTVANGSLSFINKSGKKIVLGTVASTTPCQNGKQDSDITILPTLKVLTDPHILGPCIHREERVWAKQKLSIISVFENSSVPIMAFSNLSPFTYDNPGCQTGSME